MRVQETEKEIVVFKERELWQQVPKVKLFSFETPQNDIPDHNQ